LVAVHPYLIKSFYEHEFIILYGVGRCSYRQVHIYPMDVFKRGPGRGRSVGTEERLDGWHSWAGSSIAF